MRRTRLSGEEARIEVRGSLHGETATEFHAELEQVLSSSHRTITLDLREVDSINSSTIGRILLTRKKLAEQGRSIRVEGCSDSLFGTLKLIRFDKLVPVHR